MKLSGRQCGGGWKGDGPPHATSDRGAAAGPTRPQAQAEQRTRPDQGDGAARMPRYMWLNGWSAAGLFAEEIGRRRSMRSQCTSIHRQLLAQGRARARLRRGRDASLIWVDSLRHMPCSRAPPKAGGGPSQDREARQRGQGSGCRCAIQAQAQPRPHGDSWRFRWRDGQARIWADPDHEPWTASSGDVHASAGWLDQVEVAEISAHVGWCASTICAKATSSPPRTRSPTSPRTPTIDAPIVP